MSDIINIETTNTNQLRKNRATFINTMGWTCIAIITIGILQILLMTPLFLSGYLSWDIFQLPREEFQQQLGTSGLATFKLFECIASIVVITWLLKRDGKNLATVGVIIHGFFRHGVAAFALGTGILLAGFVLLFATHYIDFSINEFSSVPWLAHIGLFIAVALAEELLFRGYLQQRLATVTTPFVAALIASGAFASFHYANDGLSLLGFANLFLAGMLFGIYYMHTSNLFFPIVLHFAWNFIQGPVLGFSVSGIETSSWLSITSSDNPLITGGTFGFEGSVLCTLLISMVIYTTHQYFTSSSTSHQE